MELNDKLILSLVAFQGEIKPVKKDADNPFFKSKYADLESFVAQAQPILKKNGLCIIQLPSSDGSKVTVKTMLCHESGGVISGELTLTAKDASPQSIGSAITYGRRYGYASILGMVASDDDDDGNQSQPEKHGIIKKDQPVKPSAMQFILQKMTDGVIDGSRLAELMPKGKASLKELSIPELNTLANIIDKGEF